jgi:glutamate-ammonia-ligase adenylyltransferase
LPVPSGEADFLRYQVAASPDPAALIHLLTRYQARHGLPGDRQQLLILCTVAGVSPFLGEQLLSEPASLAWVATHLRREESRTTDDLKQDLARYRFTFSELSDSDALRRFKHREYLCIALRDFFGKADLAETTRELSLLADVLLDEACRLSSREMLNRFGAPQFRDDSGRWSEAVFTVLSLGKLGGGELNYSSDIDLVYAFSREGQTAGRDGDPETTVSNREFFTRVAQAMTQRISGISPEGQVFRVDLGLRPGGKDGELVHSRRSLVSYYRTWARTWERQALLKVRASAGDPAFGETVVQDLSACVHVGGSAALVALEIKEMKDRIDEELSRLGRSDRDLKLGRGGIRELEFAVQGLQMAHGAALPWIHEANTLRALHRLADKDLVTFGEHALLDRAYAFLRKTEHRVQLERNRQTALLPADAEGLRSLARRMGFTEKDASGDFLAELNRHRESVRGFYDRVFGRISQPSLSADAPDSLLDPISDRDLARVLGPGGAAAGEDSVRLFKRIRRLFAPEQIRPAERRQVRRISAAMLQEITSAPEPGRVLLNLERFLSSLWVEPAARHAFLRKAEWIPPLLRLLAQSEHLSQALTRHPRILQELGSVSESMRDADAAAWVEELNTALRAAPGAREVAAEMRRFHQRQLLFTGLRDVHHQENLGRILLRLTRLAETCLSAGDEAAMRLAAASAPGSRFCIFGLGRLGTRELDYGSDLDLIFVVEPGPQGDLAKESARRRAETLIHLLTAITQEGALYNVDLRLRPAGAEGELVQTRSGLLEYFRSTARTWERMAILKARPVAGDLELGWDLLADLEGVVFGSLERDALSTEVREMKENLEHSVPVANDAVPLKLGPGGMMDIHFIIQFLQLRDGISPGHDRETPRMLAELHRRGLLSGEDYPRLYAGYLLLRGLDHSMRLLYDRPADLLPSSESTLTRLSRELSFSLSSSRDATAKSLRELVRETLASVRDCFDRTIR